MKISFIIPRWPKDSFWDVIAFKFPLLSTSLLVGFTRLKSKGCARYLKSLRGLFLAFMIIRREGLNLL